MIWSQQLPLFFQHKLDLTAFEANIKGSFEVGKLADLAVLSDNLLTAPDAELANIQVDYTLVGGEIRYMREQ